MTKDRVLAILSKENEYISGELISRKLGISRAAVNTAVKSLRAEGYVISSVTNRGYHLESVPDLLTSGALLACLPEERMRTVTVLDKTDTTNLRLKELAYAGAPEGSVVIANEQTAGRGRRGRTFASPKDTGVYLSYLLRPAALPADTVNITAWTAAAVCLAVEEACGTAPGIKWVNDLVMNGRKICGILTEMTVESESGSIDSLIVGIGLNVNNLEEDFPEEIRQVATSIRQETGQVCSRAKLAACVIRQMDAMYKSWPREKDKYLNIYRKADITAGRDILVSGKDGDVPAKAVCITDDYSLLVRYADGSTQTLSSGEVSIKGIYGK